MQVGIYFAAFLVSLSLSLVLTRVVRNYALAHGLVSKPKSSRHVHRKPIPRLGGIAIYISVILGLGGTMLFQIAHGTSTVVPLKLALGIGIPATAIFLLGLWDDLFEASPYVKFAMQASCGVYLFASGLKVQNLSFLPSTHGSTLSLLLTVFWVVLITNAFNLIDGLDGLAAGSALFSTIVIFGCSLLLGSAPSAIVTIALAGAIVGFLRYNFNPASIFLGDCGSLFIGFILSALALVQSAKATTILAVAIPIVSFGLPVLDLSLSVVRRFLSGRPLFAADGEHIHHKLLERGLSHRHAVLVLYGVSALFGLTSLFMLYPSGRPLSLVFTVLGLGLLMGLQQLRYHEMSEVQYAVHRTFQQKQIITNNLRIRRAAQELATVTTYAEVAEIFVRALEPIGFCGMALAPADQFKTTGMAVTPMVYAPSGALQFIWDSDKGMEYCWELRLPLVNRAGTWCGVLSMLRRSTADRLLMDTNITQLLQPVMADALVRLAPKHDAQKHTFQVGEDVRVKVTFIQENRKPMREASPITRRVAPQA